MKKILLLSAALLLGPLLTPLPASAQIVPDQSTPSNTEPGDSGTYVKDFSEGNDKLQAKFNAAFAAEQKIRKRAAVRTVFSPDTRLEALVHDHPFLAGDLKDLQTLQKAVLETARENGGAAAGQSQDISPIVRTAEDPGREKEISLFFVAKRGDGYCGARGCPLDIYIDFPDDQKGYQKLQTIMTFDDIYIARLKDKISLFFGNKPDSPEWWLKDGKLVKAEPMTIREYYRLEAEKNKQFLPQ